MTKGRFIVTLLGAFIIISALPGFAQRDWYSDPDLYYDLDLTSEQIDQMQKLELEFRKRILPLEIKLDTLYYELRSLEMDGANQAKIEAKLDQIDKKHLELDKEFMEHDTRIHNLLTEEQRVLYDRFADPGLDPRGLEGMDYDRWYDPGYGREYGRLYGRRYDRSRGYGRVYGYNRGYGYGRGYSRDYGRHLYGYGPGYGRGYGYGRGSYGRGYAGDYRGYYGRGYGYGRGPGWGRGYRCPYYWRPRYDRYRDWY